MERFFDINAPGYSVKCKIYCEKIREIDHVIVFTHGFGGHKDNRAAARFAETAMAKFKRIAVMTFDWPCHGSDVRKKISMDDCVTYLDLVLDYIRSEIGTDDIYAYGTSFGGYQLLRYLHIKGNPFQRIALRCPAIPMYEVMRDRIISGNQMDLLEKGKDASVGFDRKVLIGMDFLKEMEACDVRQYEYFDDADQILILHGTKDEIIPEEIVREFSENNVIEYIPIEGADHRFQDLNLMNLANSHIIRFFEPSIKK